MTDNERRIPAVSATKTNNQNADVAGIRTLLAVSDCGEHEYKEIAMNEAKALKQCQVSERFECLEKEIIQLQKATEILQDRLSVVLRQEPELKKDENPQKDQLVPLAKRLSDQSDRIKIITSCIESLYHRLEI